MQTPAKEMLFVVLAFRKHKTRGKNMVSQATQDFDHSIDMVINTLRLSSEPRWLTGSVCTFGDAARDPELLIRRIREEAEDQGFGYVRLDIVGGDRIGFNGSKD